MALGTEFEVPSKTPKGYEAVPVGECYVPDHGRGNLQRGNPGNSGRPSREAKQKWIELAEGKAYQYAVECLNDPEKSPQERIAAMNAAVKQLGVTVTMENDGIIDLLSQVLASHADQIPLSLAKEIMSEVRDLAGIK